MGFCGCGGLTALQGEAVFQPGTVLIGNFGVLPVLLAFHLCFYICLVFNQGFGRNDLPVLLR